MSWILGAIAGIGEFAGTSALEATGSAAAEQIAGSTAAGAVASEVENALDTAVGSVVDTLFGSNAYETKKKQLYSSIDEAKALGLFTDNVGGEREILQTIRDSNYTEDELINEIHNFGRDFAEEVVNNKIDLNIPIDQNGSLDGILAQLSQQSPVYYYLVNKLLDKSGNLVVPTDEEYQKVAAVYNGKSNNFTEQIAKTEFDGVNTHWIEYDETGQKYEWIFPLMNLGYTPMKSLWGVYCGLASPNNTYPLRSIINGRVVESFLDKCSFYHDIDYGRYGNFSLLADQKMISRIAQNKDKLVFPGEELMANVAVNWFSTLGNVMRKIMGDQEPDPIIKDLFKDVYGQEVGDLSKFRNAQVSYGSVNSQLLSLINNLEIELD